ncbi:MAG TPA: hypothetical protein VI731_04805, partial [Bacteroidia bacterium]|nr:hypothetical protein [Bacteroidia bacterium]
VAFRKTHPLVKPPLQGIDIVKSVYTTSASSGGTLIHPTGTKIAIPEKAFVDDAGNPVTGSVIIDYREFRDPVDIMVSGIPMVYDSGGIKSDFESAGMFEINASAGGKEVFLANGKKVDIEFAVVDTASTYNFYRLDEKMGWKYEEALGQTDEQAQEPEVQEQFQADHDYLPALAFRNSTLNSLRNRPARVDTTDFETRYSDLTYKNETKAYDLNLNKNYSSHLYLEKVVSTKNYTCFIIRKRFRSNRLNPELSAFGRMVWKTTDAVKSKAIKRLFRKKKSGINDLRIYRNGSDFTMEFKTNDGFKTVGVEPVRLAGKKTKAYPRQLLKSRYRLYTRLLEQRKRKMTRMIERRLELEKRWNAKLAGDSVRCWNKLRPRMNTHQQSMNYKQWVDFCRAYKFEAPSDASRLIMAATQYQKVAFQRLSVVRFGIFNCDHTLPLPEPQQVFAICESPDGTRAQVQNIYLLDKNKNMVLNYSAFTRGDPVAIAFGRFHNYILFAVDWNGNLLIADEHAFKSRKVIGQQAFFQATPIGDGPMTPQEIRSQVNLYKKQ